MNHIIVNTFKSEFRRTFLNDSINKFYFFSMILWPIVSLIQIFYNMKVFPITDIQIATLRNREQLFYFIFVGYCVYIIFSNAVQSAWRLGGERYQGTLSQIFIAPIKKNLWLHARTFSLILSNSWFFIVIFIFGNFVYSDAYEYILLSTFILVVTSWIWASFLSSICISLRDATVVYVLLEGSQNAFSGAKVPLSKSPRLIKIIGSLFPISYTIIYLRDVLLYKEVINISAIWCLSINIFVILLTRIVLEVGERHMKKVGSFDLF
ncbi:hypothetical protein ACVRY0_07075 [Streptococcus intermedius]|uniref:hypothetical protein n=1 Tax=Streptococcus intermedius TaxID=1338 RepID=UPI000F65FB84|nr:hypothetical protein [Streptococcus intermedius]RSJ16649.1 hypothetical protein D8830_08570 [Streptococcus intermedius]